MKNKIANLTIQKWGNSLAVRIPAAIARDVHFQLGTPVALVIEDGGVLVKSTGERQLSLDERLLAFDPKHHGGEVMAINPVGLEKF